MIPGISYWLWFYDVGIGAVALTLCCCCTYCTTTTTERQLFGRVNVYRENRPSQYGYGFKELPLKTHCLCKHETLNRAFPQLNIVGSSSRVISNLDFLQIIQIYRFIIVFHPIFFQSDFFIFFNMISIKGQIFIGFIIDKMLCCVPQKKTEPKQFILFICTN